MSADTLTDAGRPSTVGPNAVDLERYDDFVLEGGVVFVIYDRRNEEVWLRSDTIRSLDATR